MFFFSLSHDTVLPNANWLILYSLTSYTVVPVIMYLTPFSVELYFDNFDNIFIAKLAYNFISLFSYTFLISLC